MKYRSRTDIISGILQAAHGGATKTRIMYGAFLSYAQVQEYLAFLLSKGLLAHDSATGLYTQTEESLRFLHAYDGIREMCELAPSDGAATVKATAPVDGPQRVAKVDKSEMDSRARVLA